MRRRIDYMLDAGVKKKRVLSIGVTAVVVLAMGIVVSCGYKPEEGGADNGLSDGGLQDEDGQEAGYAKEAENGSGDNNAGANSADGAGNLTAQDGFDYNHVYNDVIRSYQGDLYLAKKDGIYYRQNGQGEEELLFGNAYELRRGMEIDGKYLYFCGSASAGDGRATVYRIDLDTHDTADVLALYSQAFSDFNNVSVYEDKLYVAAGYLQERIGFELDENGVAVRQLDDGAREFLYREYNDYVESEAAWLNTEPDSEEYWNLAEEQHKKYRAVMDVASCRKLLQGRQVVSRYKDESLIGIYLENEDGTYEYVCDTTGFPMLVTETGLYYPDISGEIWYADFETKQTEKFYEGAEVFLVTYDADYVYLLQNRNIGEDMENNTVTEAYLVRVPREGGDAQKVYRFKEYAGMYGEDGWYRHCGVYEGRMYFDNRESFSLDPDANNMQAVNSGEPCEDASEITRTARVFAAAYFANDVETVKSLLSKDYEGEPELYAYPEQADRIRETYIGGRGIPDENIDIGVTCHVFYEFGGFAEAGDALAYLFMEMTKTQDGFRIRYYGIEL